MSDDFSPVTQEEGERFDVIDPPDAVPELEGVSEQKPKHERSFGGWLRGLFGKLFRTEAPDVRLWDLDQTIAAYPDAPSNYVLRGELYLEIGEYELAYADFQRALALAEQQTQNSDWGIIAQAMQDRAQDGIIAAVKRNQS